jgi:hypothetical protein
MNKIIDTRKTQLNDFASVNPGDAFVMLGKLYFKLNPPVRDEAGDVIVNVIEAETMTARKFTPTIMYIVLVDTEITIK